MTCTEFLKLLDDELEFDRPLDTDAVIEQYVAGPEYSADGYVRDGEIVVAAVTRKLLGPEPRFLEIGHLTPAPLDEASLKEITEYTSAVVEAVDVTVGPFHCELRLSGDGPVLMEIAGRLPGLQSKVRSTSAVCIRYRVQF